MMEEIIQKKQMMAARYVKTQRHTIQVDWIPFMDELSELCGCKPDFSKLPDNGIMSFIILPK